MIRRPLLASFGQWVDVVLPKVEQLEKELALLRQKEAVLGDIALDELTTERSLTEGFISSAATSIDTINAKLKELNDMIKIKSSELAVTAPTIMGSVKVCRKCYIFATCCEHVPTPIANPRIAQIHREIEDLTRQKTEWTSVLSRGMGIFQGLNGYVDKVTLEINARKSLSAGIWDIFGPAPEEGVEPSIITKMLPMLAIGGILAITLAKPKEKK